MIEPVGEPPGAADALEAVEVPTRGDGLERELVGLLEHGRVATRAVRSVAVDLDVHVGHDVPGARRAVVVQPGLLAERLHLGGAPVDASRSTPSACSMR